MIISSYFAAQTILSRRGIAEVSPRTPTGKRATPETLFVPDGERASPSPEIYGTGGRGGGGERKRGKVKRKRREGRKGEVKRGKGEGRKGKS